MAPSFYRSIKRIGDVVLSTLMMVLCAPLLLLIAVCIVVESGRPVWFRQTRVGLQGRAFEIVKFRTLWPGAHDPAHPENHATRVGRVLRRWSLDELPQLWNVLRGEMSLVGPRPTIPEQVAAYNAFERRRLDVRPGLTGWAQIHGRNALSWPKRIRLDVWYVDHVRFWLDVRILLKTPRVLWTGIGVYDPPDTPTLASDQTTIRTDVRTRR